MGGQPLALALGLTVAAVLSLALTVLSSVRRRRRELALLKALGMIRGQVRAIVAWQTTLTLLVAVLVGRPPRCGLSNPPPAITPGGRHLLRRTTMDGNQTRGRP